MEREYRLMPAAERPWQHREAVRVLVLAGEEILLFADSDPGLPAFEWWVTPGGGIDPGETERRAAVRELAEETGLDAREDALVGPVGHRLVVHGYSDEVLQQSEAFYLLETERFDVDTAGHTEEEQITLRGSRWWPLPELAASDAWIWPAELFDLIEIGRRGGEPLAMGTVTTESTLAPGDEPG